MNLANETLVPLKTIARRRDGGQAVFIGTDGALYRFCPTGTGGSYRVQQSGVVSGVSYSNDDIVAISKRWTPHIGEMVTIHGIGGKVDSDGEHMTRSCRFTGGHENNAPTAEIVETGDGPWCTEHSGFVHVIYDEQVVCIHRDNIRRVK